MTDTPARIGRPPKKLTEAQRVELAAMGAAGARKIDAAARLGMAVDTLRRILAEDEVAAAAWQTGRSELHQRLVSKLIEKALDGDTVSILFTLKSVYGYREGESIDAETRPMVTINLPGALDPGAYEKLIGSTRASVPEDAGADDG